jgi:importin-5
MLTDTLRKMPLTKLFSILLRMLLDVGGDMAWLSAQSEGKETYQPGNYTLALECLGRLVVALGGNMALKAAEDMLPSYLTDSDCMKRYVGLIALAQIAQCCSTVSL